MGRTSRGEAAEARGFTREEIPAACAERSHRALHEQLVLQSREWDTYDYGEGYWYQSSDELGITGLRDTTARAKEQPVSPRGWYAATKMFMESIGHGFARLHGMSVIVARLGWCPRPGQEEEITAAEWAHDVYFSPGDAGRFFADAVRAPAWPGYAVVYACSRPETHIVYDMEPARALLGFEPSDHWPGGVEEMLLGEVAKVTASLHG